MSGLPTVEITHAAVTVAATGSGTVLAASDDREYVYLENDSDTVLYLKVGGAAVLNEGIRLNANGGSYEISARNGNLDIRAINAIHAATGGSKTLLVSSA